MARYTGPKEKIERRIGERLFLKGERSHSQKSAMVKKPYPPGLHGKKGSRKLSEFGLQLKSKQKVKNIYRLLERQFKNYIKSSLASKKEPYATILNKLESRLDNTVFRMGFGQSRDQARQLVSHGHILVNGKRVNIPSYEVSVGDTITVREGSKKSVFFSSLVNQWLKNYETPPWLEMNKDKLEGKVTGKPTVEESGIRPDDLQSIIEFYSR
ncbi:MAG: 30S ribosomal protein S4 [Candidatus Yanofskybacteria bacterium RIFCSPHIGHO2_02_FULL_44_12b]|uniref:Small ribosomal subunit protein uS4 n=1 Tax=Candidatus Yanofskybacteria bacterium GW2011_GWA2_44_9 TaxID=1619025 RepID=A0A0G1KAM7_9BACT|nr:MAG: 30S ribosomal protein S4 [Candidatus Yanofskybacteria bacterium GW2011_GWA2_44_9]OGN04936.1 MAG: 30S ribosomal protein S4 [Candidatus Yanofskybacteria bacterium RIFCSPHIGHO2_01_FULL_44_24]OGN16155.1 MAG: 30S ribosomal protein S4 [Candidatus Yanofskybacteria bacterium RIFCSPHIGHO2_02_FULL_44_12b]